jgi:two-component system chemotaxis response regulator CheY
MKPFNALVVDDDPTTLDLICSVLKENGASCLRAQSGAQAMQLVTTHPHLQLIVTDINMPELDGLSFMKCVSEVLGRIRVPPVVFLTAYPSVESTITALRLGATDFLIKPVRPTQLLEVVKRVIGDVALSSVSESAKAGAAPRSRMPKPIDPSDRALLGIDELRNLRRAQPLLSELDDTESELLLELLRSERAGKRLSVSALSISVDNDRVSSATALRRIQNLVRAGVIVRIPDPMDARRDFVALAPQAREALDLYLTQVAEAFKMMAEVA